MSACAQCNLPFDATDLATFPDVGDVCRDCYTMLEASCQECDGCGLVFESLEETGEQLLCDYCLGLDHEYAEEADFGGEAGGA